MTQECKISEEEERLVSKDIVKIKVTNYQEANGEKILWILYKVPVPKTDTVI